MEQVAIGKITNTVGLHGEVKVFVITDFPNKRFKKGQSVTLFDVTTSLTFPTTITSVRKAGDRLVITLADIRNIEEAEKYVGFSIMVDKKSEDLPKGFFFHDDLLGCKVYDLENNLIGTVAKIEDYPAHRTLRISRDNGNDVLIPFIKAFIKNVSIEERTITVQVIEGML